jgi:hypothetical protein
MSTEKPYDRGYPIPCDDQSLVQSILTLQGHVRSSDAARDAAFDLIVEAHNERDAAFLDLELAKTEISELLAQRHALESDNSSLLQLRELAAMSAREFDKLKCGEQISDAFFKAMCAIANWLALTSAADRP